MCTPHRTARTQRLSERTRVRSHERVALPRPPREGEVSRQPWATGARSRNKRRRAPCARGTTHSPTSHRSWVCRSRRSPSGSATSRSHRPSDCEARTGARTPRMKRGRQIADLNREARERIGTLSDGEFLVSGVALYSGEGAKGDGTVQFANTDPMMIRFFCAWLRRFFDVDELRLRVRVYLHQGLDLERAETFCSTLTGVPLSNSDRPTVPCPTRAFGTTSTSMVARTCTTPARRRTEKSWASSVLYYRRTPFRGSSIGGAAAC